MTQHREAIARKYTEIRALWRKHGGGQFGPRVEHVSMPEANFDGFLCDFISLFALPAPVGDWQLVPKEPTEEMIAAMWDACTGPTMKEKLGANGEIADGYKAMLAAAPPPPAVEAVSGYYQQAKDLLTRIRDELGYGILPVRLKRFEDEINTFIARGASQ